MSIKKLSCYFRELAHGVFGEGLLRGRCHPEFGQQKTWKHQPLFWLTPWLVHSVQHRSSFSHWDVPSRTVRDKKAWAIPRYTSDAQKKKSCFELLGFLPVHSHLPRKIRGLPVETSWFHFNKNLVANPVPGRYGLAFTAAPVPILRGGQHFWRCQTLSAIHYFGVNAFWLKSRSNRS